MSTDRPRSPAFPPRSSIRAAIRLLTDLDDDVRHACRHRLLAWGAPARRELVTAARGDDARLRVAARTVLRSFELQSDARALEAALDGTRIDLLAGALSISRFGRSGDFAAARVHEFVGRAADEVYSLTRGRSSVTAAHRLSQVMAGRYGMRGRVEPFYRPENVQLDRVLDARRGVASALVALYLLVGRAAGLDVTPVRLFDWFLVRVHGRRRILVDPFHGGRTVTRADCLRYLRGTGGASAIAAQLDDVDDRVLLVGLLEDLFRGHERSGVREATALLGRVRRTHGQEPAASS